MQTRFCSDCVSYTEWQGRHAEMAVVWFEKHIDSVESPFTSLRPGKILIITMPAQHMSRRNMSVSWLEVMHWRKQAFYFRIICHIHTFRHIIALKVNECIGYGESGSRTHPRPMSVRFLMAFDAFAMRDRECRAAEKMNWAHRGPARMRHSEYIKVSTRVCVWWQQRQHRYVWAVSLETNCKCNVQ